MRRGWLRGGAVGTPWITEPSLRPDWTDLAPSLEGILADAESSRRALRFRVSPSPLPWIIWVGSRCTPPDRFFDVTFRRSDKAPGFP